MPSSEVLRWAGWPGFASDGSPLDAVAVTERRDTFLRAALDQRNTNQLTEPCRFP